MILVHTGWSYHDLMTTPGPIVDEVIRLISERNG
jgi:hypothetical protein